MAPGRPEGRGGLISASRGYRVSLEKVGFIPFFWPDKERLSVRCIRGHIWGFVITPFSFVFPKCFYPKIYAVIKSDKKQLANAGKN